MNDTPDPALPRAPARGRSDTRTLVIVLGISLLCICALAVYVALGVQYVLNHSGVRDLVRVLAPAIAPVPQTTPTPWPNPQLSPGRVIQTYTFDKPQGWPIRLISNDFLTTKRSTADGKYRWETTAKKNVFIYECQTTRMTVKDDRYQISMDVRVVDGPEDAGYGIVFGNRDDNTFWVWTVVEDGSGDLAEQIAGDWQTAAWVDHLPVRRGEANTLTVKFTDKTVSYYVNGWMAGEYTRPQDNPSSFISDRLCLSVQLNDPGDHAVFEIDNYVVSVPEKFER